jgi:phage tail sheath protein FI
MPEYLAPGVYVEETSFRAKSIEGVGTTTTGFVGPSRYGPVTQTPEILTGIAEFENYYGNGNALSFGGAGERANYLWFAARAFFDEGGRRLYIGRLFKRNDDQPGSPRPYVPPPATSADDAAYDGAVLANGRFNDGHARATVYSEAALAVREAAARTLEAAAAANDVGARSAATAAAAAAGRVPAGTPLRAVADAAATAADAVADLREDAAATPEAITAAQAAARAASQAADGAANASGLLVRARFPGAAGNLRVRLGFRVGQNVLSGTSTEPRVASLAHGDVVLLDTFATEPASGQLHTATFDAAAQAWSFAPFGGGAAVPLSTLRPDHATPTQRHRLRIVSMVVSVAPMDGSRLPEVWDGLAPNPTHTRFGLPDSLFSVFRPLAANAPQARSLAIEILPGADLTSGAALVSLLEAADAARPGAPAAPVAPAPDPRNASNTLSLALRDPEAANARLTMEVRLAGGNDGLPPVDTDYIGRADPTASYKTGLRSFEDLDDIAIVAAPGSTFNYEGDANGGQAILNAVVSHCLTMRYRVAVLDAGSNQSIAQVRAMRARFDSTHAALYYPWVMVRDPVTRQEIALPPSGFVAGIYARNDIERGVWKAPANEVVRGALGFELMLNRAQQEVLNPEGVNCFRFFEGRGMRLWGARTISSDPEWKYVNVRRYFAYLEHSIDKGTQWAVFEPNGERLWANVRRTIEDFLLNEWQSGALLGDRPEKAYFVRCDRSTMTQNDLDNGRLICLIGVAPLKPAEFVIFRIGQWTADSKR